MADSWKRKIHFGTKTDSIPQRNVNLSLGWCLFSYAAQCMIGKSWHYLAPYMIKGLRHLQGEDVVPQLWQDKDWQLVLWQIHGLFSLCLPCPIISALHFLSFLYLILCPPLPSCCACIQSVTAENNRLALNWLTRCEGGNSTNRLEVTEATRELWSMRLQIIDILFHDVLVEFIRRYFEVIFSMTQHCKHRSLYGSTPN